MNSRVRLAQVSGMVLSQIQPYVGCLLIYWMLKYCFSLLVIQQVTVEPTCINVFTYASLCKLASVIKLDQPRDQQAPDYRLGWLVPLGLGVSVQCSDLNVKMCLCFLPVPLKHNSLSFFMTCLEVVRFVTLGIKPYFSLLSVAGNEKGRGEIGFQKVVLFKSTFLDIQTAGHLDIQTTGTFYLLWNSDERWLADEFCLLIR